MQSQRRVYRYDYMTRILFIFAKLNPRAEYVQGMNEVLAPIFYLVNCRKPEVEEACCFFMFNNVMTDLIELNIQAFDQKDNGIHAKIKDINKILLVPLPTLRPPNPNCGSTWRASASTPSSTASAG